MRTSAIIRIVLWSVVAVLLTGVLVAGLLLDFEYFPIDFSYPDAKLYTMAEGQVSVDDVNRIAIHWTAGEVQVVPYDGDTITFEETSVQELDDKTRMRYLVKDGQLTIRFYPARFSFGFLWGDCSKKLVMNVPQGLAQTLEELKVEAVSADTKVEGMAATVLTLSAVSGDVSVRDGMADTLKLNTVSGQLVVHNLTAQRVDADGVSGDIVLDGLFGRVKANTFSGDVTVSGRRPDNVELDSVSGSLSVYLPENEGFTAVYDSVSGDFSCTFPVTSSKGKAVYGDGAGKIEFDTVSGDMTIAQLS